MSWNCLKITLYFFHLSPTSSHLHSQQVENCDSNSRLVVGEDEASAAKYDVGPAMTVHCVPSVCDAGPASDQHWTHASCLLGWAHVSAISIGQ